MLELFGQSGMWGWILLVLFAVIVVLSALNALRLFRASSEDKARIEYRMSAIVFWGVVSLLIGFLGQFSGLYIALNALAQAREISPSLVATGFSHSLTPTILGLTAFLFSLAAWFVLRMALRLTSGQVTLSRPVA